MKNPMTVGEVLQMLVDYHGKREATYAELAKQADGQVKLLLDELVELESDSKRIVQSELSSIDGPTSTYLTYGPQLSAAVLHAANCECDTEPGFEEALGCAFKSDSQLVELTNRLESLTLSVSELAERIREMEEVKQRQIAKFTRLE